MRAHNLAILSTLLLTSVAQAQEIPCAAGPCMKPLKRGTRFLAEVNGGSIVTNGPGLAIGGVLGLGGELGAFPLRIYLVGEAAYATTGQEGTLTHSSLKFREERSHRDLAAGLRIYIPVHGPIHLFLDGMGGGSHVSAFLHRDGLSTVDAHSWHALGLLATGVQVRLFRHLSVGVRAKMVFAGDGLSELRKAAGIGDTTRASVAAGLTWHI